MSPILSQWALNTIILLVLSLYLLYRYMTRHFDHWKNQGVPYLPPTAFVGNFGEFLMGKTSVGVFLKDIYDYAPKDPVVGFFGFDKPMLLIREPEIIKQILIKDFEHFSDRYADTGAQDPLGRFNLFIIKNPGWKYLRTKISPIYTSGRLKRMFELMLEVGEDLETHMESLELKGSGKTVELKELAARFTTDMIATTAFGIRANSLNDPNAEFRKYGASVFQLNFMRTLEQAGTFFTPYLMTPLRFTIFPEETRKFLRGAIWAAIENREKTGVKRHDLIDLLIELKNSEDGSAKDKGIEFKGDMLVAQAAVFFTAGFETSSTLSSFALYELARNFEIQDRLRKEIMDGLQENDGKITYEMIMKLPYLDMVMSETLRMYPPLPLLDRIAETNYKIPGSNVVIAKGTPVYVSLLGLQNDPKYHKDPEKFDPERFSETNKEATKKAFYAFGDGPHACIGLRLGLLQSKLGLIKMLQKYEFSPCDKTLIPMVLSKKGLMTSADGGLYLNVKKIEK